MEKLDLKDRKILYQLDINSRRSFSSIGRKVGLHKDVVANRVKRLQEEGIIKNFYAVIDTAKLGYHSFRFYFSYQNVTLEIKKEIIDYFVKNKYTETINSTEGNYNLVVFVWAKSLPDAYSVWDNALKKFRNYFSKKVFSAYIQELYYGYSFLLDEKTYESTDRIKVQQWHASGKIVEIDDLDYQILKLFSENARISTVEITKQLNSTATTINNRIKKLMKSGVLIGFRVNIDFPKLGYYMFKVDIDLKQSLKLKNIIKYVEANPNLKWIIKTIGHVDLEFAFVLNNSHQLHQIMEDLSNKFPDTIKNYTYFNSIKTHKIYKF
jgi:Lrp/AsnC family leucine-responsive transcriptional regulator